MAAVLSVEDQHMSKSVGTLPESQRAILPAEGYVRLPQILVAFPVSRSTWWEGCRTGKYPKPVKLSPRCTAWPVQEIRALIERTQREAQAA
jgi:predicted DNA-binding transcriptional regulator AlpA